MKVYWGMVLVIAVFAAACGKRPESSAPGEQPQEKPIDRLAAKAVDGPTETAIAATGTDGAAAKAAEFRILDVRLTPEVPLCATAIKAEPVFSGLLPKEAVLQFEWIVNNEKVADVLGDVLEPNHFKKNAWVSCRVVLVGPRGTGDDVRSKFVRVANSAPMLTIPPLEPLHAPGEFRCQLQGQDPDGDPVSFQLISPLDQGIVLDEKSGSLTWQISQPAADTMKNEPVEIVFAVVDNDNGKTQGSLRIELSSKK